MSEVDLTETEAIHGWFGLTYANYLVLPRSILQSMPDEWQARFVACLRELDEAARDVPGRDVHVRRARPRPGAEAHRPGVRRVRGRRRGRGGRRCEGCGGTGSTNEGERYETAEEVGVIPDPIPHYNRGRTRVELAL